MARQPESEEVKAQRAAYRMALDAYEDEMETYHEAQGAISRSIADIKSAGVVDGVRANLEGFISKSPDVGEIKISCKPPYGDAVSTVIPMNMLKEFLEFVQVGVDISIVTRTETISENSKIKKPVRPVQSDYVK